MSRRSETLLALCVLLLLPLALYAQDKLDALEFYRAGRYREAIATCREELEEMPNRMDAYAVMGWSQLHLEEYDEALVTAEQALSISRYDPRIIEIAGEALYAGGRNAEAMRYFEEYAAIAPTGSRIELVYFYMGEIFIQQGRYNNADIAFSTALYHSPNVADWWSRLGYAREKAGDYHYSLEAYDKALGLNPNLIDAQRGRTRVQQLISGG